IIGGLIYRKRMLLCRIPTFLEVGLQMRMRSARCAAGRMHVMTLQHPWEIFLKKRVGEARTAGDVPLLPADRRPEDAASARAANTLVTAPRHRGRRGNSFHAG